MSETAQTLSSPDNLLQSDLLLRVLGGDAMQILRCGICMEFFDIPIVLPCGHTFCLHCLTEMCRHASRNCVLSPLKDLRIGCPNCRVLIYASPILERNVTCNFIIQSLLECLRVRKYGTPVTQGVNTEEVRLSGKKRALTDLELSRVTSDVDRLLTSLSRNSVLDNACLEVEEIRRQHLTQLQRETQRGADLASVRKRAHQGINRPQGPAQNIQLLQQQQQQHQLLLQQQQQFLQHLQPNPFGFLGLDALSSPLLTLTTPPGFSQAPPFTSQEVPQASQQNHPLFQQHHSNQQQQCYQASVAAAAAAAHHQQLQQQQQQNQQQHNHPFHHHHHHHHHHHQQQQQQQHQQHNIQQTLIGPKTSNTVTVLPLNRLLEVSGGGSGQSMNGNGDQRLDNDPAVMSYSVKAPASGQTSDVKSS
ncbi:alpha-protein kinase 1 [Aplysia californica]|uniref:Alpha-protein kinase 1 n=1 Tax=Aplysia californica TaxID=6500 RepID=A0ABM0JH15_APLCA|nr:alpha-protein kinase 1 [Aplysia californica]